jgi:hypothetical protein
MSLASKTSSMWLKSIPFTTDNTFNNTDFANVIKNYLHTPILPSTHEQCILCHSPILAQDAISHALTCNDLKGYKNSRHESVKKTIIKITGIFYRQLQQEPVCKEYFPIRETKQDGTPIIVDKKHRADILFIPPDNPLSPILGDVTIRHPTAEVIRNHGPKEYQNIHQLIKYKGLGATAGHEDKMVFYKDRYDFRPGRIIPIAFDTFGFLHDEAYRFLNKFIGKGTKFQNLLTKLSFSIHQYASTMIIKYLARCNAAAINASRPRGTLA